MLYRLKCTARFLTSWAPKEENVRAASGFYKLLTRGFHIQPEGSLGTANAMNTASSTAIESMAAKQCNKRGTECKGMWGE